MRGVWVCDSYSAVYSKWLSGGGMLRTYAGRLASKHPYLRRLMSEIAAQHAEDFVRRRKNEVGFGPRDQPSHPRSCRDSQGGAPEAEAASCSTRLKHASAMLPNV